MKTVGLTRYRPIIAVILSAILVLVASVACASAPAPTPTTAPAKAAPAPTAAPAAPAATAAPAAAAPTAAPAAAPQVFKLASIAPLSGALAGSVGNPWMRGVELGIEDVNNAGGFTVGGQKYTIQFLSYDDKWTTEGATAAAQKAVYSDNARFIFGPTGTPFQAAQPVFDKEKVMTWTATSVEETYGKAHPLNFRNNMGSPHMAPYWYQYIKSRFPNWKKVGLLESNDEAGITDRDQIAPMYKGNGWEVVVEMYPPQGTTSDFYTPISKLIAQKVDAIEIPTAMTVAPMLKQMRELGFTGTIFGGGPGLKPTDQGAEGFIGRTVGFSYTSEDATPAQKSFGERYLKKYGEPATFTGAENNFVMVGQLVKAIQKAGSFDTEKVAEALRSLEWNMLSGEKARVSGEKKYGVKVMVMTPGYFMEVKDSKLRLLKQVAVEQP